MAVRAGLVSLAPATRAAKGWARQTSKWERPVLVTTVTTGRNPPRLDLGIQFWVHFGPRSITRRMFRRKKFIWAAACRG